MREEFRGLLWRSLLIMVGVVAVVAFLAILWSTHDVAGALEGKPSLRRPALRCWCGSYLPHFSVATLGCRVNLSSSG
jgi:hypothetical protein